MLLQSIGGQADSISLNTALAAYSTDGEWIRLTNGNSQAAVLLVVGKLNDYDVWHLSYFNCMFCLKLLTFYHQMLFFHVSSFETGNFF